MKRKKIILYFFVLFLSLNFLLYADSGENSLAFLKIGIGAEGTALADAYSTLSKGAVATYWNPANIVRSKKNEIYFSYNSYLSDISQQFLSTVLYNKKNNYSVALSLSYCNTGEMPIYEIVNKSPVYKYSSFSARDFLFGFSFSKAFNNFDAGITIKYIEEKIYKYNDSVFALDAGITYTKKRFNFSGVILNYGEKLKLNKEKFNIPLTLKFGLSYSNTISKQKYDLIFETVKIINEHFYYRSGFQLTLPYEIILRLGYHEDYDIGSNFSFGFGKKFNFINFNYSYLPSSKVNDVHRFSLSYFW